MKNQFITKFERGRAIIAGGAPGSVFPVYTAIQAARPTGCGLVVGLTPKTIVPVLESSNPGAKIYGFSSNQKSPGPWNAPELSHLFQYSQALLLGPGAEWKNADKISLLNTIFKNHPHLSLVLDSEALPTIGANSVLKRRLNKDQIVIITANIRETMLFTKMRREIGGDEVIRSFSKRNQCYFLRKDRSFSLFTPYGKMISTPVISIPEMATAGMGDVLSGLLVGLLSTGLDPIATTRLAILIRQKAGLMQKRKFPRTPAILPADVLSNIPGAINALIPGAFRKSLR